MIENEIFKLLSNLYMEEKDLKNEAEVLIRKLEKLVLPEKVINKITEDSFFNLHYY